MNFLLDNCLPIREARALNEIVKPEHQFTHLQERFPAGVKDEDWISALSAQGGWVVICGDYRAGKNAHLRAAWQASGLTILFLKKGWTNVPPLEQHAKLAHLLPEIISLAEKHPTGAGFALGLSGNITSVF